MDDQPDPAIEIEAEPSGAPAPRKALILDLALYEAFFEGSDATDAQKRELLEALWAIIVGFVDLGFRVEAEDPASDKVRDGFAKPAPGEDRPMLDWAGLSSTHFENAAGASQESGGA